MSTQRETARGFSVTDSTPATLTNSATETTLFSQLIKGGRMGTSKDLMYYIYCTLTTGLLPPSITIRIKLGSSVLTVASGLTIGGSLTTAPFLITGLISNKDVNNAQFAYGEIKQQSVSLPLVLATGGALNDVDWTVDTSVDQTFAITAQFGTAILGTTLTYRHASVDLT